MIIYHQNNVAGFVGAHVWYWSLQPIVQLHVRISVTSDGAADQLIAQSRSVSRFVTHRVFGRVN